MTADLVLSAGRGPQECAWAVGRLLRRLAADATRQGLAVTRVESVAGERPGTYRSARIRITGDRAEEFAASWTGTLCWQAPSPYRAGHGRKNWYVSARPAGPDAPSAAFAESDVDVVPCRTGGPGGRHRNKASTAVRATHRPTGLVVVADTERHFHLNRRLAIDRLRRRIQASAAAAEQAAGTDRRRQHDELVRGDPVRIEHP